MKNKTKILISIILIIGIAMVALAIINAYGKQKTEDSDYVQIDTTSTNIEVEYDNQELTVEWSDYAAKITLADSKITIEGKGVTNTNNSITIKSAGTYYITGSISDGNILIEANKDDDVQLVLDNCSITSKTTAPINGIQADKLTITLADNSENTIIDSSSYTQFTDTESSEPDGAIFTKTDLAINGSGKLVVNANYSDGIVSKDYFKIINANIEVNSADDGIRGKDYVAINNANITIDAKGDGIKSTNAEDTSLGYVAIEGGTLNIKAEADGIQAETVLNIASNSQINITTNGEVTSSTSSQDFGGFGGFGGGGMKGGFTASTSTDEDSASSKALKAGTEITIDSGNIEIQSTDDSIHSNGIIVINDGTIKLSSEDDGIHADTNIVIKAGNIDITKSYEGIESSYIEINGGTISIVASDDGINIGGGNDNSAIGGRPGQNSFSTVEDSNKKLFINNGNVTVNATGDGLDSYGSIQINGGAIIVAGPTSGGNGALDYETECAVNGGNVVIYGSIGMWQNPSNTSTQYCFTFQISGKSGDEVVVKDSAGNQIDSFETVKTYGAITISNTKIQKGDTYTLYVNGSSSGSLTANSIVTSSSGIGGNGGMQFNGAGMQPDRGRR